MYELMSDGELFHIINKRDFGVFLVLQYTPKDRAEETVRALNLQQQIDAAFCPDCGTRLEVHGGYEDQDDNGLQPDELGEYDVPNNYNGPDGEYHSMSCRCYSCQMNDG